MIYLSGVPSATPPIAVAIDLETSGLPERHRAPAVIEMGVAWLYFSDASPRWRQRNNWQGCHARVTTERALIQPPFGASWSLKSQAIHGLRRKDLTGAPTLAEALAPIAAIAEALDLPVIAHAAESDRAWLDSDAAGEAGKKLLARPWICTRKVAAHLWAEDPAYTDEGDSLGVTALRAQVAQRFAGCQPQRGTAHTAAADAELAAWIAADFIGRLAPTAAEGLAEMTRISARPINMPYIPFGRFRGERWEDQEDDWLEWVAYRADNFSHDIRAAAITELDLRAGPDEDDQTDEAEGDALHSLLTALHEGPWRDDAHRAAVLQEFAGAARAEFDEERLTLKVVDYAIRTIAPDALEAARCAEEAQILRALPPITSIEKARHANIAGQRAEHCVNRECDEAIDNESAASDWLPHAEATMDFAVKALRITPVDTLSSIHMAAGFAAAAARSAAETVREARHGDAATTFEAHARGLLNIMAHGAPDGPPPLGGILGEAQRRAEGETAS